MTRTWMAGALLGLGLAAGCTEQGGTLTILQNAIPEENTCIVPADESGTMNSVGLLDLEACIDQVAGELCDGYVFTPVIRNEALIPEGGSTQTNEVFITSADIELTNVRTESSAALIEALGENAQRSQRFTARIEPGGTAGAIFPIINRAQAIALADALEPGRDSQVLARIQVHGTMNGGGVKSSVYEYPVTLCEGCLMVQPPPAPVDGSVVEENTDCLPYQN